MKDLVAGLVYLLAPLLCALAGGLPVAALLWLARRQDRQRAARKGFDLQTSEGEETGSERKAPGPPHVD